MRVLRGVLTTLAAAASVAVASCLGGGLNRAETPATTAATVDAQSLQAGSSSLSPSQDYQIGAIDLLKISVFQVPDLSFDEVRVDASGNIQMPLIGSVRAANLTPSELSIEITTRLAPYLQNPQVMVTVVEAASQKVTVDGAVTKPGVYTMRGHTTLLQAIAMAEGPTRTAALNSVAVFRNGPEGRMVAVFDLRAIRAGLAEDPTLAGDDVVVVDTSRLNSAMREVLTALPGLSVFAYF